MLNLKRKLSLIPLIIVFAASIITLCLTNIMNTRKAIAELDYMSEIKFTVDSDDGSSKTILPGGDFTVSFEISTQRTDLNWAAVVLYFGVINEESTTQYDGNVSQYFSTSQDEIYDLWDEWEFDKNNPYCNYQIVMFEDNFDGKSTINKISYTLGFQFSSPDDSSKFVNTDNNIKFTLPKITVSEDIDKDITSFKFGIMPVMLNRVTGGSNVDKTSFADMAAEGTIIADSIGLLKSNYVTINIRQPGENATLDKLTVGHDADGSVPSAYKTFSVEDGAENPLLAPDAEGKMAYVSNSKNLSNFTVTPVSTDEFAKIEISLKPFAASDETDGDSSESGDGTGLDGSDAGSDGGTDSSDGTGDSSAPDIVTVTSGKSATFTLAGGANTVYVRVTSEDGKNQLVYTVDVAMAYVRLESVAAASSSPTDGVTKNGLSDTFDPDTEENIIVYVPGDFDNDTGVKINASILTGYGANDNISAVAKNCSVNDGSFTSGNSVFVNNFAETLADGESYLLTLTALAANGQERKYNIVFEFVSVDTSMTLKAIGKDTAKELENNSALATTNDADYYFFLTTEKSGEARLEIVYPEGATVTIDGVAYINDVADTEDTEEGEGDADSGVATVADDDTSDGTTDETTDGSDGSDGSDTTVNAKDSFYGEGTYTIVVTAEAGNTKTYVVILAKQLFLKLAEDSKYQFLTEETQDLGIIIATYRRAYGELKKEDGSTWEHGIDDTELDRVVLGQVKEMTTINEFLKNIDPNQLSLIRLYTSTGVLVYDCGAAPDGVSESDWDNTFVYMVGTGWCVKYGPDAETADTVYISVLGDLDGSGNIDSNDSSAINYYIMGKRTFDTAEFRLAAYVSNAGDISSVDSSQINLYIMGKADITSFFFNPTTI